MRSNIKHSTQCFITRWNTSKIVKNTLPGNIPSSEKREKTALPIAGWAPVVGYFCLEGRHALFIAWRHNSEKYYVTNAQNDTGFLNFIRFACTSSRRAHLTKNTRGVRDYCYKQSSGNSKYFRYEVHLTFAVDANCVWGFSKQLQLAEHHSTPIWTTEICLLRDTFYTLTDLISHPVIIIDGISLFTDLMQKCSNESWEATNNIAQRLSTCLLAVSNSAVWYGPRPKIYEYSPIKSGVVFFNILYHVQNIPQQTAGKIPVVPRVPIFIMQQIVLCLQFNFMAISVFYQQTAKFVAALSCPLLCGICHRNESKNAIQE